MFLKGYKGLDDHDHLKIDIALDLPRDNVRQSSGDPDTKCVIVICSLVQWLASLDVKRAFRNFMGSIPGIGS